MTGVRRVLLAVTVLSLALLLAAPSVSALARSQPAAVPNGPAAATTGERYAAVPPQGVSCRERAGVSPRLRCVIGTSVQGRAIVAERQGPADAPQVLLVSGQMHGNEWPGPIVVRLLRALPVPAGLQVWTVRTMNPDGRAHDVRHNAHGVDLNRNFAARWRPQAYSGPRAWSEPESRAMRRLLRWIQPDVVVSFHGFSESVDTTGGGSRARFARSFARLSGIGPAKPVPCDGPCRGNMTEWYTRVSRVGGAAFTVEMPRSSRGNRPCPAAGGRALPVVACAARSTLALLP